MKIVVFGANGMMGNYIVSYFKNKYNILSITRKDIDLSISSEKDIFNFIVNKTDNEDVIINAAAIIKQRDYNTFNMIKVNSLFPHILAEVKETIGCKIIHITTDCVFSGLKGNYIESDDHDSSDDYGKSKSLGENNKITNIRTSIIGEEKYNKKSLLEWVKSMSGRTINGYNNHLWNGVTCLELCKVIENIIIKNSYWEGTRHVTSPDTVSKYELISLINEIYGLKISINKVETSKNCFRNLSTSFDNVIFNSLKTQIEELKIFNILKL